MKKGTKLSQATVEGLARYRKEGVKFCVASADEITEPFEERKRIESPYRVAINQMINSPVDLVLRFDNPACRVGLKNQSVKMGVPLLFAEQNQKLYVRLRQKSSAEQLVLELIRDRPAGWTKQQIVQEFGERHLKLDVDAAIRALASNSLIRLQKNSHWTALPSSEQAPA